MTGVLTLAVVVLALIAALELNDRRNTTFRGLSGQDRAGSGGAIVLDGGCLADIGVVRTQPELFGPVYLLGHPRQTGGWLAGSSSLAGRIGHGDTFVRVT